MATSSTPDSSEGRGTSVTAAGDHREDGEADEAGRGRDEEECLDADLFAPHQLSCPSCGGRVRWVRTPRRVDGGDEVGDRTARPVVAQHGVGVGLEPRHEHEGPLVRSRVRQGEARQVGR